MDNAELIAQAENEFEKASKKLSAGGASKNSAGLEASYNRAYRSLVALGRRPKLRGKYNG